MLQTYSLVIQPSPSVISEVKEMKEIVFQHIGWYPSKNSMAHITINEFKWEKEKIDIIKQHLCELTQYLKSRQVCFDHLNSFPNGAFYIAPSKNSRVFLKDIMLNIHKGFAYKTNIKSSEPHISIGRQITDDKLKIAFTLFQNPPILNFLCDRLALRVFNTERKQFDIIEEFIFGEKEREGIQQLLF